MVCTAYSSHSTPDFTISNSARLALGTASILAADFSNGGGNNQFAVGTNGDIYRFDLDLPNGRWRVAPVSVFQHGDFNADGVTNAADYVWWRKNNSGNAAKYTEWRNNYGYQAVLTWVAHGSFGNDVTLTDQGGGNYTTSLTGLTPGTGYDVQVLRSDASSHWPGSPAKITADASGNINLKFYQLSGASWGDGWQPDTLNRVGYVDPHQFGWEVVGAFNGWPDTESGNPAYVFDRSGQRPVYRLVRYAHGGHVMTISSAS